MNTLYEYIDPITSPYEAFCSDSQKWPLPIPSHWHYYIEIIYILEGTITCTLGNSTITACAGSVVLFPPKCIHSIALSCKGTHARYDVIKFDPDTLPALKTDGLNLRVALHSINPALHRCFFSPKEVAQMQLLPLFCDILEEYEKKELAYSMILIADLLKILGAFARVWKRDGNALSSPAIHPSYALSFDLVAEYIDTHYFENLSVEKLASMCHMSHSTFSLNFYRRYGMTCKEYITATRINVAENMLLFSNHDIAFIAQEVGYSDSSYFIRCYKRLKGITPKQARKARL